MSLEDIIRTLVEFVRTHQYAAVPLVFALAFGESLAFLSLLLPATTILIAISALLGAGGIAFLPIWLAATAGSVLGYWLSYWIGYVYKDGVHGIWPFRTRPEMLARGTAFFARYGTYGVFIGHFFGPLRAVVPVVAGMLAMRQAPFMIANVTSSALWSAGVLAPALLVGQWPAIKSHLGPMAAPLARLLGLK